MTTVLLDSLAPRMRWCLLTSILLFGCLAQEDKPLRTLPKRIAKQWNAAKYLVIEVHELLPGEKHYALHTKKLATRRPRKVILVSNRDLIRKSSKLLRTESNGERLLISFAPMKVFRVFIIPEPALPREEVSFSVVDLTALNMTAIPASGEFKDHGEFLMRDSPLFAEIQRWERHAESLQGVVIVSSEQRK